MEASIAKFLARQSASEQLPSICVSLRFIFRLPRMPSRSTDVSAQGKGLEGSAQTRTSKSGFLLRVWGFVSSAKANTFKTGP